MADIHNEYIINSLGTAFSSVKEALDTTVKIEQNAGMSTSDRTSNVTIIKTAIERAISILQNCGASRYAGIPAPAPLLTSLRIEGGEPASAGATGALTAMGDFADHNGQSVSIGGTVLATWTSSDSDIVSINSSSGVYSALVPGNVTITARHVEGAITSIPLIVV